MEFGILGEFGFWVWGVLRTVDTLTFSVHIEIKHFCLGLTWDDIQASDPLQVNVTVCIVDVEVPMTNPVDCNG